jgi:uncharacterized damage-inducible protein DinB
MIPQAARALALVQDVHGGEPWHGFPTRRILDGITAPQAAARPGGGAHSIWEIVLHMTAWTREAEARLAGRAPGDPEDGDWPAPGGAPTAEAWQAARTALDRAQDSLAKTVGQVPDDLWAQRFDTPVTVKTRLETLEGLAVHHAYHAGQIAVLKRLVA